MLARSVVGHHLLLRLAVGHGPQLEEIPLQLLDALPNLRVGAGERADGLLHLGEEDGQPLLGQGRLLLAVAVRRGL